MAIYNESTYGGFEHQPQPGDPVRVTHLGPEARQLARIYPRILERYLDDRRAGATGTIADSQPYQESLLYVLDHDDSLCPQGLYYIAELALLG